MKKIAKTLRRKGLVNQAKNGKEKKKKRQDQEKDRKKNASDLCSFFKNIFRFTFSLLCYDKFWFCVGYPVREDH